MWAKPRGWVPPRGILKPVTYGRSRMGSLLVITLGLNVISAGCALLVLVLFAALRRRNSHAVARVSIRLQAGIAFVDLVKHVVFCFAFGWEDSVVCSLLGFTTTFLFHVYLCLNICIALNLHVVILKSRSPSRRWESYYWMASLAIPLLLNVPLLGNFVLTLSDFVAAGVFGSNESKMCLIRNGPQVNDTLELVYLSLVTFATIAYCIVISSAVVVKAGRASGRVKEVDAVFSLRTLVSRTCLYPATCFLACIGSNISLVYYFCVGPNPPFLLAWGLWGYSAMGILNLAAFLADPLVLKTLMNHSHPPTDSESKGPQVSPICEYSYNLLVDSQDPGPRDQMVRDFQAYI